MIAWISTPDLTLFLSFSPRLPLSCRSFSLSAPLSLWLGLPSHPSPSLSLSLSVTDSPSFTLSLSPSQPHSLPPKVKCHPQGFYVLGARFCFGSLFSLLPLFLSLVSSPSLLSISACTYEVRVHRAASPNLHDTGGSDSEGNDEMSV